ncbi:MAG: hypothetical protein KAS02_02185 [Candidatus Pacebacteria bacterium]|nr:hypothetical protein [Candidatus Paceibacterota bacterium]
MSKNRSTFKFPIPVADCNVPQFIAICRNHPEKEIQINISLPESPSQGGLPTKPYGKGGPEVLIEFSFPIKWHKEAHQIINRLVMEYD